jgi:uncharacterized tellurite resistance protein B-like protein
VEVARVNADVEEFVAETVDLSRVFSSAYERLSEEQRAQLMSNIARLTRPFVAEDGTLRLPGRSLVACAAA